MEPTRLFGPEAFSEEGPSLMSTQSLQQVCWLVYLICCMFKITSQTYDCSKLEYLNPNAILSSKELINVCITIRKIMLFYIFYQAQFV